jgi:hypothetical protein
MGKRSATNKNDIATDSPISAAHGDASLTHPTFASPDAIILYQADYSSKS